MSARIKWPLVLLFVLLSGCAHFPVSPDFRLTDDRGASWSLSAQRGRVVLVDFGFTHCADTCPLALAKLVRVANAVDPRNRSVEIAFITVDPQRDTPAVLHAFVSRFDTGGRVVGLTGTPEAIDAVETAYHVWAQRVPGRVRGTYDVAHSAAIYYVDASGSQRALRDDGDSAAELAAALREII
ncbi:MAG: SCO family protein [Candidatus Eremiobacteraeota bacterium]|nr:SCO family protein [Candidatus Eremiobacteraeota bacterium]